MLLGIAVKVAFTGYGKPQLYLIISHTASQRLHFQGIFKQMHTICSFSLASCIQAPAKSTYSCHNQRGQFIEQP